MKTPKDELESRMYIIYGWFIVLIIAGLMILRFPEWVGLGFIVMSFFLFNIFMTLYKFILYTTKRLIEEENKKCQSEI